MISVIVPAHNEQDTIGACLEALLQQEGLSVPYEIIVVDDGSSDRTAEIVEGRTRVLRQQHETRHGDHKGVPDDGRIRTDPAVVSMRLVAGPGRGAGGARNAGARAAQGDVFLFTDADCRPSPGWAAALVVALQGSSADGAVGFQRTDQKEVVPRFVQAEYDEKQARMRRSERLTFADTAAVAYRASVFRDLDGFNEHLKHFEDTDLAFRFHQNGHELMLVDGAVVLHHHAASVREYVGRKLRIGYWGALVYRRFPDMMRDDSRTPASMRVQMLLAPVLTAVLLVSPWLRWGIWIALVALVVFVAACRPFHRHAIAQGVDVASVAPVLLWLRAMALGLGLAAGTAHLLMGRHRGQRPATVSAGAGVS